MPVCHSSVIRLVNECRFRFDSSPNKAIERKGCERNSAMRTATILLILLSLAAIGGIVFVFVSLYQWREASTDEASIKSRFVAAVTFFGGQMRDDAVAEGYRLAAAAQFCGALVSRTVPVDNASFAGNWIWRSMLSGRLVRHRLVSSYRLVSSRLRVVSRRYQRRRQGQRRRRRQGQQQLH
jgi:hypothetical protein